MKKDYNRYCHSLLRIEEVPFLFVFVCRPSALSNIRGAVPNLEGALFQLPPNMAPDRRWGYIAPILQNRQPGQYLVIILYNRFDYNIRILFVNFSPLLHIPGKADIL